MVYKRLLSIAFIFIVATHLNASTNSESFLAEPKNKKAKNVKTRDLKEDIADSLAISIEHINKKIELESKINTEILKDLKELALQDKNSKYTAAAKDKLSKCAEQLKSLEIKFKKETEQLEKILEFFKNNCEL